MGEESSRIPWWTELFWKYSSSLSVDDVEISDSSELVKALRALQALVRYQKQQLQKSI